MINKNSSYALALVTLLSSFVFFSCTSEESVVKTTITGHLKNNLTNPKTLKIESLHISMDTVPYYFNIAIRNAAKEAMVAFDEYEKYKDRSDYLWKEEKSVTALTFFLKQMTLSDVCDSITTKTESNVENIVCVEYAYKDALGDIVDKKCIYIISKENPEKILTSVEVDSELRKQVLLAKMTAEGFELKQDQYGETDFNNLPYVECFMFEDI